MYYTEYQVTLRFTSLSCIRLLVVTTDYTLVLYLCRGEGSTYRNQGKRVHCSEQWERMMERVPIVLDNRHKEQCSALIWGTMGINSRQ
jgi:hypothetical protein